MKARKPFATLTLGLIVATGVIAKCLPVTISISRTALVFGIAFASGAIVFVIRTRQAEADNHRYRAWMTQIGQMTAIIVTDVNGVMEWVSEGFTRITGYQFDEAVGRVPGELLQGADTDRTKTAQMGAALRDGRPVACELINYTKDGRAIWIGMHARPMIDGRGVVSGHIAIQADITERHERRQALERMNVRFTLATRAAHIGVFDRAAIDNDLWWNDVMCEIFGEDPSVFRPTVEAWLAHIHPADLRGVLENAGVTDRTRATPSIQYRIVRADGTIRHLQAIGSFAGQEPGDLSRITGMVIDITERVEAEERERTLQRQLRESSHRAGMAEIATGVLHNVGNVLNSLGIANTMARRELRALRPDRLQQASSMIQSNRATLATYLSEDARGRHLPDLLLALSAQLAVNLQAVERELHTIDQLLDHLRHIVSDQQSLVQVGVLRGPIWLQELVDSALVQARDLSGIEVTLLFDDLPPVVTERHKLLQIVVNLLNNARDAVRLGGSRPSRIIVRLCREADLAVLWVEDTGIGMSADVISCLWQFGHTTKADGHGFGLHNSAIAAREIGATIEAHSEGINKGSRFILRLPFDQKPTLVEGVAA
jgi:PAS domain S-box-containing protein